jgi:hypothetical protein
MMPSALDIFSFAINGNLSKRNRENNPKQTDISWQEELLKINKCNTAVKNTREQK